MSNFFRRMNLIRSLVSILIPHSSPSPLTFPPNSKRYHPPSVIQSLIVIPCQSLSQKSRRDKGNNFIDVLCSSEESHCHAMPCHAWLVKMGKVVNWNFMESFAVRWLHFYSTPIVLEVLILLAWKSYSLFLFSLLPVGLSYRGPWRHALYEIHNGKVKRIESVSGWVWFVGGEGKTRQYVK